jgi:hypothetical protein
MAGWKTRICNDRVSVQDPFGSTLTPTGFWVRLPERVALPSLINAFVSPVIRGLARCRRNPLILQVVWRIVRPALRV